MNKKLNAKKPSGMHVKELAVQVRSTEFLYFVDFADTLIRYVEIKLKRSPVKRLQGMLLFALVRNGGRLTPTHLAKLMLRSKHSMTSIIDSLEKRGLVIREPRNSDCRVVCVRITGKGLDTVKRTITRSDNFAVQALDCLVPEEKRELIEKTEKVRKHLFSIINELNP